MKDINTQIATNTVFVWFTAVTDSEIQFSSLCALGCQYEMKAALFLGSEVYNSWERPFCLSFLILIIGVQWEGGVSDRWSVLCFPKDII